ncbi:MAG: prolyl oligopeptidase family serine peptidase [Phycisphaerales bacterium]|nr:prolyl oligopeptidase family serine peptidase [Phycisphaerales bacterium]
MITSRFSRTSLQIWILIIVGAVLTGRLGADDLVVDSQIVPLWRTGTILEYTSSVDGKPTRFLIDATTGRIEPQSEVKAQRLSPKRVNRSSNGGLPVDLVFKNRTNENLDLFWLDSSGTRRPYGRIPAGADRTQGTFAGHAWRLVNQTGQTVIEFETGHHGGPAIVDDQSIALYRSLNPKESRRGPRTGNPRQENRASVFVRDHDLWLRDHDETERRLTSDGSPADRWTGNVQFAPDGRHFVATRIETPETHLVNLLHVAPDDQVEPKLKTFQYLKPGDRIAHPHPVVFEVNTGRRIEPDESLFPTPWSISRINWHPESDRVRFLYNQRGHQSLRLIELDVTSGETRTLIDESSPTFLDYAGKLFLHVMAGGDEAIWMSERSGWNHLEKVDLKTGDRTPLTSGPWVVRAVDDVDEAAGMLRIRVMGMDPEQDPYHVHHATVDLKTGDLVQLTKGDGTHKIDFSPDGEYYVDRWSRVDLPPVHELRRTADGSLIAELATADHTGLLASGWTEPERFVAKGRDGETDIWGVIIRPKNFDPSRSYPVVEHIYAGPHDHFVPKSFSRRWRMRDVADLGFVVVQIDGMGTNWRSKAFHDVAWKNLGDSGFPDRIAWMKAAAADRPWMNLDRVGIYGGSAGGQSALRALLAFGDFYHVAVADCGCHDNRMDKIWWNELWMGWPVDEHYAEQSNVTNAHRLEGDLMLVLGGLDRNVDPASTLQVVDALVKADKDFEFVLMPSAGHGAAESAYGNRRRMDFLKRKLLDVD